MCICDIGHLETPSTKTTTATDRQRKAMRIQYKCKTHTMLVFLPQCSIRLNTGFEFVWCVVGTYGRLSVVFGYSCDSCVCVFCCCCCSLVVAFLFLRDTQPVYTCYFAYLICTKAFGMFPSFFLFQFLGLGKTRHCI